MGGRAHSTLGTLGPPPPFVDDVDGGDVDVYDAVDGGESDDQPRSFHPLANSEDFPQPTSHLDSEPDIHWLKAGRVLLINNSFVLIFS